MQIKEVEALVGISQKNIRFYEKEGLLAPRREAANGYRNYAEDDVQRLRRIKLLRKLDVPLDEIHDMLDGKLTLADGMRRHLTTLDERRKNLETAHSLCAELTEQPGLLENLDAAAHLEKMQALEQKGVRFMDIHNQDKKKKYHSAWIAAAVFIALMLAVEGLMGWTLSLDPPPLGVSLLILGAPLVFVGGAVLALWQRIKEIRRGESDAYRNY